MKMLLCALAALSAAAPVFAGDVNVGVSITVDQPGLYGRIDIGNVPPPRLVYERPVVVRPPVVMVEEPLYLHVPPGHARHWSKHCREYDACGRRVFFVDERWYNDVYVPARHPREEHGDKHHGRGHDGEHGDGHGHGHGHGHDDKDD